MAHLGTKLIIFILVTNTLVYFVGLDMGVFETTSDAKDFKNEIKNQSGNINIIEWEGLGDPVTGFIANTANVAVTGLTATADAIKRIGAILFAEWAVLPKTGMPTSIVWIFGSIMSFLKFVAVLTFIRGRGF